MGTAAIRSVTEGDDAILTTSDLSIVAAQKRLEDFKSALAEGKKHWQQAMKKKIAGEKKSLAAAETKEHSGVKETEARAKAADEAQDKAAAAKEAHAKAAKIAAT